MRIRNLIVLLVVLPLLAWGAVKGFIWYSLDAVFKQTQARVSHLADISYRDVRTTVLGPIGFSGVTIRPKGYEDVIKIGSILAHWKEPKEVIPILEAFFHKSLPQHLDLSANQIALSLDSDLGDALLEPDAWEWQSPLSLPASIWGCGSSRFQAADYRVLKYHHLSLNARLEYSLAPATNTLDFYLRVRNADMMSVSLEGSIPTQGKNMPRLQAILRPGLKLANLAYTHEDDSYNEKKVAYCAKKSGESPADFVESQIARISADLEHSNLYPSTELSEAYRSFLTGGTRVTVNLDPFEPAGLVELAGIEPQNLEDWLGLSVLADNKQLDELFLERKVLMEEEEEEIVRQKEETFNPTPLAELGDHLNRLARIRTNDGKTHYAYIETTAPEMLVLTQHLVGGSATFELAYRDIVEVAVLY